MKNAAIVNFGNVKVLFSYNTCVAMFNEETREGLKTSTKHSVTTSKHINQFFRDLSNGSCIVTEKPQEFFDKNFQFRIDRLK